MDVFEAFPEAIETWALGEMSYGTIQGNKLVKVKDIRVIVDEGDNAKQDRSPNSAEIESDTLLYAMPGDLPTTDTSTLVSSYAVKSPAGRVYAIVDAGQGRNQARGRLEHIELRLRPTGAFEDGESE